MENPIILNHLSRCAPSLVSSIICLLVCIHITQKKDEPNSDILNCQKCHKFSQGIASCKGHKSQDRLQIIYGLGVYYLPPGMQHSHIRKTRPRTPWHVGPLTVGLLSINNQHITNHTHVEPGEAPVNKSASRPEAPRLGPRALDSV